MAYPLKDFTAAEYVSLPYDAYEYMAQDKIYYMPQITDGNAFWNLKFYDINNPQGQPVIDLSDTPIQTGYRVLMTTELSGTIAGGQQSHLVLDSGTFGNKKWINTSPSLASLPLGTVVSWTIFTQSYEATTAGPYSQNFELIGTFLKQIAQPFVLPSNNTYVYTQGEDVNIYKNRIYIINTDSNVILNQEFDPTPYQINGFLIKNEATIMQ